MHPLVEIWREPRATYRELLENRPGYLVLPLAAVHGIVHGLHLLMRQPADASVGLSASTVVLLNVVVGAVTGVAGVYVLAWCVTGAARMFGVHGSARDARTVLGWSWVPYVPMLVVLLPLMLATGDALVFGTQSDAWSGLAGPAASLASVVYLGVRSIFTIVSIAFAVVGLSQAFRIGTGKSFLILLSVPVAVFVVAMGVMALLVVLGRL